MNFYAQIVRCVIFASGLVVVDCNSATAGIRSGNIEQLYTATEVVAAVATGVATGVATLIGTHMHCVARRHQQDHIQEQYQGEL